MHDATALIRHFAAAAFILMMIAAAVIDLRRRIIPDAITLGGTACSLLYAVFRSWTGRTNGADGTNGDWPEPLKTSLSGLAAGLALALAVYALGNTVFKARIRAAHETDPEIDSALGMGDVKFMAFAGAFLGPAGAFHTLLVASVLAALVGAIGKFTAGAAVIPFGPFLAAGGLVSWLLGTT